MSSCSSCSSCGPAPGDYLGKIKQEQKDTNNPLKAAEKALEKPKLLDLLDPAAAKAQQEDSQKPGSFKKEKGDTYSFTAYA